MLLLLQRKMLPALERLPLVTKLWNSIASVAVGATVGAYSDANGLPIGTTYRYAKPTFLRKVQLTGSVELSGPITPEPMLPLLMLQSEPINRLNQCCNDGATPSRKPYICSIMLPIIAIACAQTHHVRLT